MSGPMARGPGASTDRALRRLFLTLFLRGRSARGLRKENAPQSVASKLSLTLFIYAAVGCVALTFRHQPIFTLSIYLHGMTLVFLGMTIATSAGEVLFNKEEADILLHRPITPRALLRAKVSVLVQVSLWLAGAFNLAGMVVGFLAPGGGWLFPIVHAVSTAMQALFCMGGVVLAYELCLRWFGRERLDSLMTMVQVFVGVAVVLGGQLVPQLIARSVIKPNADLHSLWIGLLPPAWFAGIDDALAGKGATGSWMLAVVGLLALTFILWLAFVKMAHHYEEGLQNLGEASVPASAPAAREVSSPRRSWVDRALRLPFLRWWLRDPVARASFRLTSAYLLRDRETKLRIYPGLAPMMIMPLVILLQDRGTGGAASGFGVAFAGGYVGLVALLGLNLLQFSQHWQASDLFRVAPVAGPAEICDGARRAVLCFLALPTLAAFGLIALCFQKGSVNLPLLIPGIIALPIYALYPHLGGRSVPFSVPGEEAKSASRGLQMMGVMLISMAISGLAVWSWSTGWFQWLVLGEIGVGVGLYLAMRRSLAGVRWASAE